MLTQQVLKDLLYYDPNTGDFTYKTSGYRNRQKIGDEWFWLKENKDV